MSDPLAPYEPSSRDPFDLRKAGHLLRRAGFGGSLNKRRELASAGPDAAVAAVYADKAADSPVDGLLEDAIAFGDIARTRAYRVLRALEARQPLRERMSIFWHGHFATSNRKIRDSRAMALQMATFDRLGLSSFDDLCLAMAHDPALLRWLDNDKNVAGKPNENFARELFELFTLGRGNYTETCIKESARAFTGYQVHRGQFRFIKLYHDDGQKDVLGQRGAWTGDDVVRLAVEHDASGRHLAGSWLRHFVHPEPEDSEVEALASCYRANDRHVGRTLRTLLRSRLFFSGRAYRSRIKSPADYVLGLVRGLSARAAPTALAGAMGQLGESWLEPPSVEGWHSGRAWLTQTTWLLRNNFAADLLSGRRGKLRPHAPGLLAAVSMPSQQADLALLLLLDGDVSDESYQRLLAFAASPAAAGPDGKTALLHATTALPEYQLL